MYTLRILPELKINGLTSQLSVIEDDSVEESKLPAPSAKPKVALPESLSETELTNIDIESSLVSLLYLSHLNNNNSKLLSNQGSLSKLSMAEREGIKIGTFLAFKTFLNPIY